MRANFNNGLIHFLGAALACAQIAYWAVRLTTSAPTTAPPPPHSSTAHDPDPVLLAREFGDVEHAAGAATGNIQLAGVFAAGPDSAAVFVVGDQPARAVRLGQEVAPGSKLVEVDPQGATLESDGVRRQLRVPALPSAQTGGSNAAGNSQFSRQGDVLTAPSVQGSAAAQRAPAPAAPSAALAPPERQRGPGGGLHP